jgi:hypothetical protein
MASTYLFRANGTATGTKKGTISVWFKRSALGSAQYLYGAYVNSTNRFKIELNTSDIVEINNINGGSDTIIMNTNRKFRDTSAWYHLVFKVDTTQSTEADRVKLYINGVQETSFSSVTYPSQDDTNWKALNSSSTIDIGAYNNGGGSSAGSRTSTWDGLMSHFHFTDGYAYDASTFGSTDSTTGEWKINANPTITMGNNGFTILKDGNTITDQSANSNNFTASGTLTSTKDCPSNVYTTWNYLNRSLSSGIQSNGYLNGGTFIATETANNHRSFGSTLAFPGTGKFYCEFKVGNLGGAAVIGIMESEEANTLLAKTDTASFSDNAKGWGYKNNGYKENGGSSTTYGSSFVNYSYLQIAYNNGALWFGKDGTWQNSATATEIANATTGNAAYSGLDTTKNYYIMFRGYNDSMIELNAGNGWFRTTEVSSPNNPSSGDTGARFKYAVPTGLQPVSTKGFNA